VRLEKRDSGSIEGLSLPAASLAEKQTPFFSFFAKNYATNDDVSPRHATALVLIVWYLMVPPLLESTDRPEPNVDAPFSEWQRIDTFDSQDDCDKGLDDHLHAMQEGAVTSPSGKPVTFLSGLQSTRRYFVCYVGALNAVSISILGCR
jgi:hypothetical protein